MTVPPHLAKIHDVFDVSLLWKAELDPTKVLPKIPIEIHEDLTVEIQLVKIVDWSVKELRNKKIPLVKVMALNIDKKIFLWWAFKLFSLMRSCIYHSIVPCSFFYLYYFCSNQIFTLTQKCFLLLGILKVDPQ